MSDRRQFFSLIFGLKVKDVGSNEPFFPLLPWFMDPKSDLCLVCEEKPCKTSCSENIVILTTEGTPRLDFSKRGCTFCGDCAMACQNECFEKSEEHKIDATVSIDISGCLAWHHTICRSCADVCNDKAIKFLGMFHPEIDPNACSSCGFCVGICPSQTIKTTKMKEVIA